MDACLRRRGLWALKVARRAGSSVHLRSRVSHLANKCTKTLLHMAALSPIRMAGEMKEYYQRKVAEGKNKMSVINAIRNKLILRVFACVRNNKVYQKIMSILLHKP